MSAGIPSSLPLRTLLPSLRPEDLSQDSRATTADGLKLREPELRLTCSFLVLTSSGPGDGPGTTQAGGLIMLGQIMLGLLSLLGH